MTFAPGTGLGPCSVWCNAIDVAQCCDMADCDEPSIFDAVAQTASDLLFELSGRLFAGTCERTVRPCGNTCRWGYQVLSRGHVVGWYGGYWGWGGWWGNGSPCGCRPLSTVPLSGYPVQEIVEVLIDGDVVDPVTYRLDRQRNLVRVRDPAEPNMVLRWPTCQALDLPDTEVGTFSVTYTYGQEPPQLGRDAAAQLACELYKACNNQACALPRGTVRVTRQGVTIEKAALVDWTYVPTKLASRGSVRTSGWRTGMPLVDAFLGSVNPTGLIRRPIFTSPASHLRYPLPVGGWLSS